jgi:hypothetical protein
LKENASQLDVLQQELGKILQAAKLNPKKNK